MCKVEINTKKGDELKLLMFLVESYENEFYPIDEPDSICAIKFRTEQLGLYNV
ncbi:MULTISPECIES: hypothetical protein [unclassified Campylobacter]|uniref:hypothetical protein n=1 Tax=unclassified Campylobacter TaxID=2593542 RepID=UPI001681AAB6|nr:MULTISPECIES: hypothetical protein [unclassified Campylobacter]